VQPKNSLIELEDGTEKVYGWGQQRKRTTLCRKEREVAVENAWEREKREGMKRMRRRGDKEGRGSPKEGCTGGEIICVIH